MRAKLRTPRGQELHARRKQIVEPVFGQMKEGRGFRRFLLRGLSSVQGEWSLLCTAHNLLKLYRGQVTPAFACGGPRLQGVLSSFRRLSL